MDMEKMRAFINMHTWRFAKTYANIAPHEYIVKTEIDKCCWKTFEDIVVFIRQNGFEAFYKKKEYTYLVLDEYYYWTMGDLIEETIILNRALLSDYELTVGRWTWKGSSF